MRLILAALLVSSAAWAQRDPDNGRPSPAVQEQQRQSDHARKEHPKSNKPRPQEAAVKTKDKAKPARAKPGEASVKVPH